MGRDPKLVHSLLASLPLVFEPNRGQGNLDASDRRVQFVARGSGYSLFLGSEGAVVSLRTPAKRRDSSTSTRIASLQMRIAGSNRNSEITASDRLPGTSNYILGNDPARWRTHIPQFARVRYENIYPGINLVFYGNHGRPEFDFQVAPGCDPAQAELEFEGANGLKISEGALVIQQDGAEMRLEAPHIYQQVDGREQTVEGRFVLRGAHRAGFAVGAYDRSRELIIDPVPTFSTYFGGSGNELNTVVAVDSSGIIYLAGSTTSPNLPVTPGVLQTSLVGAQNVYVAKINPSTSTIEYVTYLGGNGTDIPAGIAVDGSLDAYLAGTTSSSNFPTTSTAYQTLPQAGSGGGTVPLCSTGGPPAGSTGPQHVFVTKLNPTATTLSYSSYLSGSGNDVACGMAIDSSGNIYITGTTTSTAASDAGTPTHQFPASYPVTFQASAFSTVQFFVTQVNPADLGAGSIPYSTYFGGSSAPNSATIVADGGGIAVDQSSIIYFSGTTNFASNPGQAGTFPILNAYQPCLDQQPPIPNTGPVTCTNSSANPDAFVAKLIPPSSNRQGAQLQWSTYLGGAGSDSGNGVAVDPGAANVYLVGTTNSSDITIPIVGQPPTAPFQACLDNPTSKLGSCPSVSSPAPNDAFVARFPNLSTTTTSTANLQLNYFSYLGGSGDEAGLAIVADNSNGALVTGSTTSATDFPAYPPGEIQTSLQGQAQAAFVARINTISTTGANQAGSWATYFGGNPSVDSGTVTAGTGIAIDVNQNTYFAGNTNAQKLQIITVPSSQPGGTNAGGFDAFVTQLKSAAGITISGVATLGNNQSYFSAGVPATFTYTITNNGPDLATGLTVTDNISQAVTGVPVAFQSASAIGGLCGGGSTNSIVTCTINSLQAQQTATVTIVLTPTANPNGNAEGFNGGSVQVLGQNNILLAETSVSAQMADFGIVVTPTSQSVPVAGYSATYQVQITPHPVFGTSVALSCTGQPAGSNCSFTPSNSVPLIGSAPATATLTISTTARPIVTTSNYRGFGRLYAACLIVPGLAFVGIGMKKGNRRRFAGCLLLGLLFLQLVPLPACSSAKVQPPPAGTPPGTYNITVSGAAGSDSKSQTILLTVP
jgi:uncharacterized repeat protein (TIGR01451 family)